MTISTTYAPDNYAGNGSTTVFAITFAFLNQASNVKVSLKNDSTGVITVQSSPSQYSISGLNVTMVTAPASGETLILELNPDFKQASDYRENDEFPAETLETDLDERTLEGQINNDLVSRAIRADASVDLTGKSLALDFPSSGTEVLTITPTSIGRAELIALGAVSVTGTTSVVPSVISAGTSGNLAEWDASGNLIDGPTSPAGTIVGTSDSQTLTNKTLTSPTISTIVNTGTLTLPTSTDTLVGRATTDTLTNKTLTSPVLNGTLSGTAFLDEDTMASNSATAVASQQSIKAYVDAEVSAVTSGKSVLTFTTAGTTVAGGLTRHIGPAYLDTAANINTVRIPLPYAGTIKNMYVFSGAAPIGAETFVYTAYTSSAQSLTVTLTGAANQGNDTVNSFAVTAGTFLTIELVTSASATTTTHQISVEYTPS